MNNSKVNHKTPFTSSVLLDNRIEPKNYPSLPEKNREMEIRTSYTNFIQETYQDFFGSPYNYSYIDFIHETFKTKGPNIGRNTVSQGKEILFFQFMNLSRSKFFMISSLNSVYRKNLIRQFESKHFIDNLLSLRF